MCAVSHVSHIKPFKGFKVLDGYHCQTSSFARMYAFNERPLSEEMFLGLGAGMGFIFWHTKQADPFLGGRANKNFHLDVGRRTGVRIEEIRSGARQAEKDLLEMLRCEQPVAMLVDMGMLPPFDFGEGYHFGGHLHVVCGFDGEQTVLISEIEPRSPYLKKGFTYELSLEQLAKARNSKFKPFPPGNGYYTFDFAGYRPPTSKDIYDSIKQTIEHMLKPPLKNFGVAGIRTTAARISKWGEQFDPADLRRIIFNIYIYIHIGGTGSGLFRYMYGRFLQEAAGITSNDKLMEVGKQLLACGDMWTEIALPLENALKEANPGSLLKGVPDKLIAIADAEEKAFNDLKEATH